jgi:DNA polymerase-3 subunit beta
LLPESYVTRVEIESDHFASAVKRISLLNSGAAPLRFDINKESQTIQLSSVAQDIGSGQETLSADVIGEDTEIAFNYAYLLDGLNAIGSDKVFLEIQNSTKPGIFKTSEEGDFLYLIMPVRIQ